jgi:hypothetical protein
MPDPLAANPHDQGVLRLHCGRRAAGSVVAGELSRREPKCSDESGPADTAPRSAIPASGSTICKARSTTHCRSSLHCKSTIVASALAPAMLRWQAPQCQGLTRGMERDYDAWAEHGVKRWARKDVLPMFKAQEDGKAGPTNGAVSVGRCISDAHNPINRTGRRRGGRTNGFPILDD